MYIANTINHIVLSFPDKTATVAKETLIYATQMVIQVSQGFIRDILGKTLILSLCGRIAIADMPRGALI